MRAVRSMFIVVAAVLAIAAPRPAPAQMADPYVSCVRCHALPLQQAQAALGDHVYLYPQPPEAVCDNCHDTRYHEQDPSNPPIQPFFWGRYMSGTHSTMTRLCLSSGCHTTVHSTIATSHSNDVFPFFDGSPPTTIPPSTLTVPKSVLPLYDYNIGVPNQNPIIGGLVCSTCHDPHDPSYVMNGSPKFLRIGMTGSTSKLCNTCHIATPPGGTQGTDLIIASRSDSVRFQRQTDGSLKIDVKVRNRGNVASGSWYKPVYWVSETGGLPTLTGSLYFSSVPLDGEATSTLSWQPPPGWQEGGFFTFELPASTLKQSPSNPYNQYVRAMNILPAPTNLRVNGVGSFSVRLEWDPLPSDYGPLTYDVYRDGVKVNPYHQIMGPIYDDVNLAPETPHVYTVRAVQGNLTSAQSDPLGTSTAAAIDKIFWVPYNYPTIQAAINAAWSGTSIHVVAGTYTEQLSFMNKSGITVKGQDANGCILEAPSPLNSTIGLIGNGSGNTLSGFTIKNQSVVMSAGDVLAYSVLQGQAPAFVADGGLVAQCVFDSPGPTVYIGPGRFFAAVNSIFRSATPLQNSNPPLSSGLFLNNNFPYWTGWSAYQGSDNFGGIPTFEAPGPPDRYFTEVSSITTAKGLQLENWYPVPPPGPAPDVGAFAGGQFYTPKPPSNLSASWQTDGNQRVRLTWTLSPDDARRTQFYYIYRSITPSFPPGSEFTPYMQAPRGMGFFEDSGAQPGVIYYYQVRAFGGVAEPIPGLYPEPILSAPTNTARPNVPPVAVDDAYPTSEDTALVVGVPGVLVNDPDVDSVTLNAVLVTGPAHGALTLNSAGSFTYTPAASYNGPDSFTYRASDGQATSNVATVTITVDPINDPPVSANDGTYSTPEDTELTVGAPGVLANDTDNDSVTLSAVLVAGPAHGTLTLDSAGSFTYTPAANYFGPDSFTYRASDGQLSSDNVATVSITVTSVNDAPLPEAGPDKSVRVGVNTTFNGSGSRDVDGTIVSYSWNFGDGTTASGMTVTRKYKKTGTYTVTLTVKDNQGAIGTDTARVTVTK